MQRVISRDVQYKLMTSLQRITRPVSWDSPGCNSTIWKNMTGRNEAQSWTRNIPTGRPAHSDSSNQPAERNRLDESKGSSQKAPNQIQSDSLERESSTFSHFESVRDEMAKEGKHADEPDTQPGYWETSSQDKEADNSRGESGISGTESQKKLKEKWGGVASDKKGVTSEAEEELRSGPAKSEYQ